MNFIMERMSGLHYYCLTKLLFDLLMLPSLSLTTLHHHHSIYTHTYTVLHPLIHKYQTRQSYLAATNPNRIAVLSPDLKRVRANQQRVAEKRAAEAKEEQRQRKQVERERKRVKSPEEERWDALGGEGRRLGVADADNGEDVVGGDGGLRQRR